jgi:hypothetical protein
MKDLSEKQQDTLRAIESLLPQHFMHLNRIHLRRTQGSTLEFRYLTLANAMANEFLLEARGAEPLKFDSAAALVEAGWVMD